MPYTKSELRDVDFYNEFVEKLRNNYKDEMKKVVLPPSSGGTNSRKDGVLYSFEHYLTGLGIDFHSLIEGDHLIVGGHKIDCDFSSKAHSDGDVLTHSIIDALLGVLNLGDIGEHFPNTSENLNISSIELLKKIIKKIPNNKKILHIDSSIVLNEPKISPHKESIKESLSKVLKIKTDQISIKSTTTNALAFLDMSTGWGVQTILTLGDDS